MDFAIPDDLKDFIRLVERFREKELMPVEADFLREGKLERGTSDELRAKAREQGFWALDVPVEFGGQGMGTLATCLVEEELAKFAGMFSFGGSVEPVLYEGNADQRKRYVDSIISGEKRSCFAFTEPQAGSDLRGIKTSAVQDGSNWVINGTKTFISGADRADFCIVFARTSQELGARGITVFIVDMDTPGFTLSRPIPTMGDGWEPYELSFVDCVVPDANRLGEVNGGWALGAEQLTHGRVKIAAKQLGIAQRCLDMAIEWAKERETWGKPIATRQAIQWMVADSAVELDAARLLVYRAAWLADEKAEIHNEAFIAKLYATEMSQRVTDRCLQIFGGLGYARELPIQSFFRQSRVWRIGHGTTELNRWMIARNLLGLTAGD